MMGGWDDNVTLDLIPHDPPTDVRDMARHTLRCQAIRF